VPLVEQELTSLSEPLSSPLIFTGDNEGVRVSQSLVFYVVFCWPLLVFFPWPLYFLSFELQLLNTLLVSFKIFCPYILSLYFHSTSAILSPVLVHHTFTYISAIFFHRYFRWNLPLVSLCFKSAFPMCSLYFSNTFTVLSPFLCHASLYFSNTFTVLSPFWCQASLYFSNTFTVLSPFVCHASLYFSNTFSVLSPFLCHVSLYFHSISMHFHYSPFE
jgi:hypothetical protein